MKRTKKAQEYINDLRSIASRYYTPGRANKIMQEMICEAEKIAHQQGSRVLGKNHFIFEENI